MFDTLWPELSATLTPWTEPQWDSYELALYEAGWQVEHCSHCDRSNRHPSCLIQPIPGREQRKMPKPEDFEGASDGPPSEAEGSQAATGVVRPVPPE